MAKKQAKRRKRPAKKKKRSLAMTRSDLAPLAAILVVTAICFFRTAGYDFVNWDDDFNITKNPNLRAFDWNNIKGIFTSHVIGNYNPLSTLSFAIEKHFFGLDPAVFHTTNVILHLICTFLVYRLSRLLGLPVIGAFAVGMIFGIHPMKVESVAWITERKDVLYGAFYLGALINYVKWQLSGKKRKYIVWIVGLFALSLLSKIQAVSLPLSMLAIDYLMKRPLKLNLIIEKWYYFLMSLATGLVGIYFLGQQGSLDSTATYTIIERILIGMHSFVVYIAKFFVPFRISPLYPYPGEFEWYIYLSPVFFLAVVAFAVIAARKKWRTALFGLAFFTLNIMFVLQVVGAGQAYLADRFTYIPYFGLSFAFVYYLLRAANLSKRARTLTYTLTGTWIVALLVVTWIHVPIWKNSGELWTHVLQYYQNSALPFRNRAQFLRENGEFDKALADYARSIALKADPDVVNSRARMYFEQQDWENALKDYNRAIELNPDEGEYWINRGAVYAMLGNYRQALDDMTQGVERDPEFLNGYKNRSLVYQALGQYDEALSDLQTYLRLNPYDPDMWYESARLHRVNGNNQEALDALNRAIRMGESQGTAKGNFYLERARTLAILGRKAEARADLARAEQLGMQIDQQTRNAVQ